MNFDPAGHIDAELHRWSLRYMWLSILFVATGLIIVIIGRIALGLFTWFIGQIIGYYSMKWHKRSHGQ